MFKMSTMEKNFKGIMYYRQMFKKGMTLTKAIIYNGLVLHSPLMPGFASVAWHTDLVP